MCESGFEFLLPFNFFCEYLKSRHLLIPFSDINSYVVGVDADPEALEIASLNAENLEVIAHVFSIWL